MAEATLQGSDPVLGQPRDARPERFTSYDVADFAVPTGREEEWRFTPLARLRHLHSADREQASEGKLVDEVDAGPEVRVETVERDDARLGRAFTPYDRVSALAWQGFPTATVVTIPAETITTQPVVINRRGEGGNAYAHLVIDVQHHAQATVVLEHTGSTTLADNIEIVVGDGASLTLVSFQDWASDTVHVGSHALKLGRDSRAQLYHVTLGGDLVRIAPTVDYTAPGGDAELYGLYFADTGQHLEHRLFVDHEAPNCRSRVAYKGALQGDGAHAVWIGDVLIRANAVGTDTYELNRNLLLTDGARADSVPNLEIETGEVLGAGHASATGRFDDAQLFYLQSRGIPADEARRLVVRGFFAEIIDRIGVTNLQERLIAAVDAELERVLT